MIELLLLNGDLISRLILNRLRQVCHHWPIVTIGPFITSRKSHCVSQQEVLERVNRYVRGWVTTFTCTTPRESLCGSVFSWSNGCESTCGGDDRSKGLGYAAGRPLGFIKSLGLLPFHSMPNTGKLAMP